MQLNTNTNKNNSAHIKPNSSPPTAKDKIVGNVGGNLPELRLCAIEPAQLYQKSRLSL